MKNAAHCIQDRKSPMIRLRTNLPIKMYCPRPKRVGILCALMLSLASRAISQGGIFSDTGNMVTGRYFHTATELSSGKVLVAGGQSQTNTVSPLASAELYDPTTGTFASTGSMSVARWSHCATPLPNGVVLVMGGSNANGSSLSSAELYDPSSGLFSSTGSMAADRSIFTCTLLPSGMVLVIGGYGDNGAILATAELYNPSTGQFSPTGSMNSARAAFTAALLPSGKVLVSGGATPSGNTASAEIYDPSSGLFSSTGSMLSARASFTSTLLVNGDVLVAGGVNASSVIVASAELYDSTTGLFASTGSMGSVRYNQAAVSLTDGSTLVVGGYGEGFLASAEVYEPIPAVFSSTGSMNTARVGFTATLVPNGSVLVTGGYNSTNQNCCIAFATAELYQAPAVFLSPKSLAFGNQVINTISSAKSVVLTNTGQAPLTINDIAASSGFVVSTNTCGSRLAAGKKCKVSLSFTPVALGPITGNLTFIDDASNSPQTVGLSGTGVAAATLTPTSVNFGMQKVGTTSAPRSLRLTNNQTATLNGISISAMGDFSVSTTNCATTLAAKANCSISVTFTPTQSGLRTGQLSVTDSASNSPQTSTLTGTGK